uniref:Uncharacterized protein n=1 Tax=Apteryx owenii TaxID=8824 RepID=A0A8B9PHH7_APTOW
IVYNKKQCKERISHFHFSFLLPIFHLGLIFSHLNLDFHKLAKKMEAEFQQICDQLQGSYNPTMRKMVAAGFYHTGVESSVQCFCCRLVLFRFHPMCEFVLGKEVGNISKYICVQYLEKNAAEHIYRYNEEEARLQSFDGWPFYARGTQPALLDRVGFFFTAERLAYI